MHYPSDWLALLGRQSLTLSLGVVMLLALRRPMLRAFGPGLRYAAWSLVPLLMLATALPTSAPARVLKAEVVARFEPLSIAAPAAAPTQAWWQLLLAAVWAVGALAVLLRLLQLQRRYQRDLTPHDGGWQSPAGSGPALVGLLRPRLALPADFEQRFDAKQQALVLAHEDVHRARRDNHWNALAALLCVLHWFNPLAWLALRCMRADQELACDAAVIARHPGSEAAYGRALLLAQGAMPAGLPWAGWQSPHPLVERMHMLKRSPPSTGRRAFGLLLFASLTLAGASAVQAVGADDPAAPRYELKLDLSYTAVNGDTRTNYRTQPVVHATEGRAVTVMLNGTPDKPSAEQIAVTITARGLEQGQVELRTEVKKGHPLVTVSRPRVITANGVKALIEQGTNGPGVNEQLSLAMTPTLLPTLQR